MHKKNAVHPYLPSLLLAIALLGAFEARADTYTAISKLGVTNGDVDVHVANDVPILGQLASCGVLLRASAIRCAES